jgi:hypothetical protein
MNTASGPALITSIALTMASKGLLYKELPRLFEISFHHEFHHRCHTGPIHVCYRGAPAPEWNRVEHPVELYFDGARGRLCFVKKGIGRDGLWQVGVIDLE